MGRTGKSFALALVVTMMMVFTPAWGADQGSDPGEQIKQGFIGVGHGIRDGAIKAWGAVSSAFKGNGNGSDKSDKPKASDKQKPSRPDDNK